MHFQLSLRTLNDFFCILHRPDQQGRCLSLVEYYRVLTSRLSLLVFSLLSDLLNFETYFRSHIIWSRSPWITCIVLGVFFE